MTKCAPAGGPSCSTWSFVGSLWLGLAGTVIAQPVAPPVAGDWQQFLGQYRDGISRSAIPLIDAWPGSGPKEVWRASGGGGMSGIAISGKWLCTLVQKDG